MGIRDFIMWFMPAKMKASAERESRQWKLVCPKCGFARSVWDMGGIRYKASGTEKTRLRCQQCNEIGWHFLRKDEVPPTPPPAQAGP